MTSYFFLDKYQIRNLIFLLSYSKDTRLPRTITTKFSTFWKSKLLWNPGQMQSMPHFASSIPFRTSTQFVLSRWNCDYRKDWLYTLVRMQWLFSFFISIEADFKKFVQKISQHRLFYLWQHPECTELQMYLSMKDCIPPQVRRTHIETCLFAIVVDFQVFAQGGTTLIFSNN